MCLVCRVPNKFMNTAACAALAGLGIVPALPAVAWAHALVQRYDLPGRILAILSVAVFLFLIAAGLLGTQEDPLANILPAFVWVAWWVGLGFVCALAGNVWPAVNPWAAVPAL